MRVILFDIWAKHKLERTFGHIDVLFFNPLKYISSHEMKSTDALVKAFLARSPEMLEFLSDVKALLRQEYFDVLAAHQNPFPPEWLIQEGGGVTKVLGCFDDPQATYTRTLPAMVAYQGAYYCSPSFSHDRLTKDVFRDFGINNTHWFPLAQNEFSQEHMKNVENSWNKRESLVAYVGKCYGSKVDRLALINAEFGRGFRLYGRGWPLGGLAGFVGPLRGRRFLPRVVRGISDQERKELYLRSLIGFNLHLGDEAEVGNMRTYETTSYGMLLLCDRGGCNVHEDIFEPDVEAIYYGSVDEAISIINRCFSDRTYAVNIARNGYERAKTTYNYDKVMLDLFEWAGNIPNAH
ncbi:MAG: glycosyltransferase family 1 protein [Gammaproteobacteria bacterium]|nr:glycosyltransferase family 1 protein [Gammaproteobacteria bacterium]